MKWAFYLNINIKLGTVQVQEEMDIGMKVRNKSSFTQKKQLFMKNIRSIGGQLPLSAYKKAQ